MSDLLARSSSHWSEAGRAGMEAFYTLATDDYRHLAQAWGWQALFETLQARAGDRPLHLLDVACGSGKFPKALARHTELTNAPIYPIETALLDPSAFSIAEARAALPEPFRHAAEFQTPLQGFTLPGDGYDVVWATHALYAIPAEELAAGLKRFVASIAPGGVGVIAHSAEAGHYVSFHRHFLEAFGAADAAPYISAETIVETLRQLEAGVVDVEEIDYETAANAHDNGAVEGFLQRCVFDEDVSLAEMQVNEPTATYLAGCHQAQGWRFPQCVWLITVTG